MTSANYWRAFGANAASKNAIVIYSPLAPWLATGCKIVSKPKTILAISAITLISRIDEGLPRSSSRNPGFSII